MADLTIETYQLCWGDGIAAPVVLVATGLRDRRTADQLQRAYDEMRAKGQLDPAVYVPGTANTFYVRTTPGSQTVPITATTFAGVLAELGAPELTVPLFMKVSGAPDIRALELSLGKIQKLVNGAQV